MHELLNTKTATSFVKANVFFCYILNNFKSNINREAHTMTSWKLLYM